MSVEPQSRTQHPVRLTRTVRITVPLHAGNDDTESAKKDPVSNGHNAKPAPSGYALYYAFEISCVGTPDEETGYLISIQDIDSAFRSAAGPILNQSVRRNAVLSESLRTLKDAIDESIAPRVTRVRWWMTPNQSIEHTSETGTHDMDHTLFTERFEFAAAHRLAVPNRSDTDNFDTFGKCANPNFHGHNYVVEVSVKLGDNPLRNTHTLMSQIVNEHTIDVLDHKNLNKDVLAFDQSRGGRIPSVENIARFCYESLLAPMKVAGIELNHVRVWETERTSCTYPA